MNPKNTKVFIAFAGALSAVALFTACGDEITQFTNSDLSAIASYEDLGDCNSENKGRIVYVDSSEAVYLCADSVWKEVNLSEVKGKNGKDGSNGKDGADGKDGKNGTDGKNGADGKDGTNGKDGVDGKDGKDGTSCTVEALKDGSGYDVLCGGKKVGTLTNGKDGAKGADGKNGTNGTNGENGTSCEGKSNEDGSVTISCGGKVVGTLKNGENGKNGSNGENGTSCEGLSNEDGSITISCGGKVIGTLKNGEDGKNGTNGENGTNGTSCSIVNDKDGVVTLKCGDVETDLYKAVCGATPYDPTKKFCYELETYDLCDGKTFNPSMKFCYESKTYDLCGGKSFDPKLKVCYEEQVWAGCGSKHFSEKTHFCFKDYIYELCGGKEYDPENEFCAKWGTTKTNIYKMTTIGYGKAAQTWMAENLNEKTNNSWCGGGSGTTEGDCNEYGRLYTWAAAVGKSEEECGKGKTCEYKEQGICPDGWHLPTKDEWETLFVIVGGQQTAAVVLKSLTGWRENNGTSEDIHFYAKPAGNKVDFEVKFANTNVSTYFWSSTMAGGKEAYNMCLRNSYEKAFIEDNSKDYGYSIRCLQDK